MSWKVKGFGALLTDFSKAPDSLDHKLLTLKLNALTFPNYFQYMTTCQIENN